MEVFKQLIKSNKYDEIIPFVENHNIEDTLIKNSSTDILIFAISHGASILTLQTLLNCFSKTYQNLNYVFQKTTPLAIALSMDNMKVTDFLINHGARINFVGHQFDNVLFYLYRKKKLNKNSLCFLLENNVETYGNKFLYKIIKDKHLPFLSIYLSYLTPFNLQSIIKLLNTYKNKIPISQKDFNNHIEYEKAKKYKLVIDEDLVSHLCLESNEDILKIVLKNQVLCQQFYALLNNIDTDYLSRVYNQKKRNIFKIHLEQGAKIHQYHLIEKIFDNNDKEIIECILANGAISNIQYINVAYVKAIKNDILQLFIENGADFFIPPTNYEKLLEFDRKDTMSIFSYLKNHYHYKNSTLFQAIVNQNVKIVHHLLQTKLFYYSFNISKHNYSIKIYNNLDSEFFLACKTGNMVIINLFIQKGVNINYIDKEYVLQIRKYLLNTPLSIACENNNYELVLLLLNLGADMNPDMSKCIEDIKNSRYRRANYKIVYKSALMHACEQKNKSIVNQLINNGAAINEKDLQGKSIFMYVCEIGNINNVQFLINNKHCNITDEDKDSNNVLHHLCRLDENKDNHIEILECLLNTNKFDLEKQNNEGETALCIASNYNNNKIVRLLIEHGAEINPMNSPLLKNIIKTNNLEMAKYVINKGIYLNNHLLVWDAYELKQNEMIKLLIKSGVDLYISDTQYEKLLKLIIIQTDVNILPYLEPYYKLYQYNLNNGRDDAIFNNSTLSSAIKNQNIKIIKHLLQTNIYHCPKINKCSFNYIFENYDYELCLACRVGNIEMIKLLIEKGARINCIYSNIYTPLNIASKYNHLELVQFLLNNGAQINPNIAYKYKKNYKSALIYACEQGHPSI